MAAKSPFDDELSADEEKLLQNADLPPAADEESDAGNSVDAVIAEAGQKTPVETAAPAAAEPAKPGEETPAAAPVPTAEEESAAEERALAAFVKKHEGKPPEEILKLAFQQNKRASKSEAQNRQVNARLQDISANARALAERRNALATKAADRKAAFREKLTNDPDGATAELHDQMIDGEVAEADEAARIARVDAAIVFADEHIADFGQQWPNMAGLAKEIGFSDDDLNSIDDGRTLVVLSLANHAARLMKAGVMDRAGNIDLSKIPAGEAVLTDPRLTAPDPQRTLGGRAASSARGAQTIEQQLAEIESMSDAEMAKFETANPGVIDELLRKAAA